MPTTTSDTQTRTMRYYESYDQLNWKFVFAQQFTFVKRRREWPLTIKRPYPSDLFLNGTARTTRTVLVNDSGFTHWVYTYPAGKYEGDLVLRLFPDSWVSVPDISIDRILIYNKIRSDVRGAATNLAQNLAEYRETAKLFSELIKAVVTKGRSLVEAHPGLYKRTLKEYSKAASREYLRFQYGVNPLCDDIASALKELRASVDRPIFVQGVESRKSSAVARGVMWANSTVSQAKASWTVQRTLRYRTQWRAYLNRNAILSTLTAHGFTNPLAIGYELVPFSFVVDWWFNIGEVLASLDNLILIDRLVVQDSSSDRVAKMIEPIPGVHCTAGSGFHYTRTDTRNAPVEISKVSTLRYKPSVSRTHILNGLALAMVLRK